MRDSYALQLFSLENCLKCLQEGQVNELMYLLPWVLQEEVLRNPALSRAQRLEKATLSFGILTQYFNLSRLPHDSGVSQRFDSKTTRAVTFVDDASWLRVLNSTLMASVL
jgi:hypothetical protein